MREYARTLARVLLTLACLTPPAWADDPPPNADAALRSWLEGRKLSRQLGNLRDHALQIAGQQGCPSDLAGELRESLRPESVFDAVVERLLDADAAALLPPVEAFRATPLGLRIDTADQALAQRDADDAWQTGASRLLRAPPDPGRAARIERVARASRQAELWAGAESRLRSALRDACLPAATGGRTPQEQTLLDAMDTAQGAQRRVHFLSALSVVLYEGYGALSDADLEAYAAFLESAQASDWIEALNAAIVAALDVAVRELIPPAPVPL